MNLLLMNFIMKNPVKAQLGSANHQVIIHWRNGEFMADEPFHLGGEDSAPDPFTLLLASLASCTITTLKLYLARKQWLVNQLTIETNLHQETKEGVLNTTIVRNISYEGELTAEQQERLISIANACPVSKLLKSQITIQTTI